VYRGTGSGDEPGSTFPDVDDAVSDVRLMLTFKSDTYDMLKDERFWSAVRAAYPDVDFDKPFREFEAVPSSAQLKLG
jgi:hypothetical protein